MSVIAALTCGAFVAASADDVKPKRQLKGNMMEVYNVLPGKANSITEAFTNGVFYGRLRANSFMWDWKNDDTATGNKDNKALGLGGSMIYKTASFEGLSATAGMYFSTSPFAGMRSSVDDLGKLKAGKDTISRHDALNGKYNMAVLAQSYLQYDFSKNSVKLGRQIFESFLTKSNDTKMIPNTFSGIVVETKEIPKTRIRGAYFTAQKLRDHSTFHDVITFGTTSAPTSAEKWDNNDDSAVHKGLSFKNFTQAGKTVNHDLIVADVKNKSIENLQADLTYGSVPGVVSSITGELNYKIDLGNGYSLTPGVRYMKQMDNGGGKVGGANLGGNNVSWAAGVATYTAKGYKTPDSLDSSLAMARLVLNKGPLKAQIAYSAVEDAADIVAPWRGFPTGGYTRAMAQYNWYANTKTTAAEVKYNFGKANLIPGFTAMVRYAMQDFDEAKQAASVQADSNIIHIDLLEQITPELSAKLRVGLVDADKRTLGSKAGMDVDSYNEYRFELNYLF